MRDIRGRIAQRHGIELTEQQVQELAARRLEAILDPRLVKPALLDQLRRSAGSAGSSAQAAQPSEPPYRFEDTTIYDSHHGVMRFIRKLFNPLLKLFFNPNPVIRALAVQSRLNVEAAQREGQREQQQAEWNALHYEILQRLVTEVARASLEIQSLSLRVESLAAKVDFNERRVRGIEGSLHQTKQAPSREPARESPREPSRETERSRETVPAPVAAKPASAGEAQAGETTGTSEGQRRRRRRRRGRRGGAAPAEPGALASEAPVQAEGDDLEDTGADESAAVLRTQGEAVHPSEAALRGPAPSAPEPVEPQAVAAAAERPVEPPREPVALLPPPAPEPAEEPGPSDPSTPKASS
jgi:hypothetical protein